MSRWKKDARVGSGQHKRPEPTRVAPMEKGGRVTVYPGGPQIAPQHDSMLRPPSARPAMPDRTTAKTPSDLKRWQRMEIKPGVTFWLLLGTGYAVAEDPFESKALLDTVEIFAAPTVEEARRFCESMSR
jgi:hypothetical protein